MSNFCHFKSLRRNDNKTEHGKVNCLLLKLNRKLRKMFLSPRWESSL